ncbi:MAG: hypothetical protein ACK5EU_13550 [Pseudanabaena sp.]|jgi:hypothetical protein|uniref:hypothetical protein n=1 Tax=Pseudanabaena mucicola TaxID=71190 RepID=UPI0025758B57|nr:hypothetical protein [Pseudanabaena mucicola]MCA6572532.1 hypothetical protein [Pseudanabaena sp. M53BS1SP1A06MG]MCA6583923.1 hypothetical protein [Pseudanabaena sp. M34BS1SP1A06MG]MCA6585562.1 hypothetical protein [Pseudanabaena sp. M051S1SP1A06QC]MCA6588133.1 hypothetical protein [Pseudanabaena sp. M109S1SP1A06QC]MCA6590871.1 hypothetical protein [Pseudanabaena sp. M38BS1SP1A06MG]MCA6596791.1 hypothetical protein [Pseudanabaena sp. M046S1SP1A06QC]MCA6600520.1 hypothetical protein [Pseud
MKVDISNASMTNVEVLEFQVQQATENVREIKSEQILCEHCLRTASNGIKCRGICVADSGY